MPPLIICHHYHHHTPKCTNAKSKNITYFRTHSWRRVDLAHSKCKNQIVKTPKIKTENKNANGIPPQNTSRHYHHHKHKCPNAKSKNSAHFRMFSRRHVDFAHSNGKNQFIKMSKMNTENRNANYLIFQTTFRQKYRKKLKCPNAK